MRFLTRVIQKLSRTFSLDFLIKKNFSPDADYFSIIYQKRAFGLSPSASGTGSTLEITSAIRNEIPRILQTYGIESIADIPCGDFHWMSNLERFGVEYRGYDIVLDLISDLQSRFPKVIFDLLDATEQIPKKVDLILCRDLFVHLTTDQIHRVLRNFESSGSTYLLTTSFVELSSNRELVVPRIGVGWRPVNLAIEPFNLGEPIEYINEATDEGGGRYRDKSLGLWKIGN